MPRLTSLRFVLHPSSGDSYTWSLVWRTDDGRDHFDRRICSGRCQAVDVEGHRLDVLDVLDEALADARRRHHR